MLPTVWTPFLNQTCPLSILSITHSHMLFRNKGDTGAGSFVSAHTHTKQDTSKHTHTHTFKTSYRPGMGAGVFKLLHDDAQRLMGCGCDDTTVV